MEKKIQAIISVNGEVVYYLYDDEIESFISTWVKFKLEFDGRKVDKVETKLNSPIIKSKT